MSLRITIIWNDVPNLATVIDEAGVTHHVLQKYSDAINLVWHKTLTGTVVHAPGELCTLILPDEADAIVNLMSAGLQPTLLEQENRP